LSGAGTVFEIVKAASGYASTPTILYSFCSQDYPNCTDGAVPQAGLIVDASGNLFGTTSTGTAVTGNEGTVFEIEKTATGYASTPTILVSFNINDTYGTNPWGGLIADAVGNLFGTTFYGTAFEIAKTASGYTSTPITLASFNGYTEAALIADAKGNLFGTTVEGGSSCTANSPQGCGTVFEITGSGFVPAPLFAGTPRQPNCHGQSVSALAQQYGGLAAAAAALGYSSVPVLQNAIVEYCAG
jgi:hypothetical protein